MRVNRLSPFIRDSELRDENAALKRKLKNAGRFVVNMIAENVRLRRQLEAQKNGRRS
jgi:hypothetical protein